jgi:hypothetical protein
VDPVTNHCAPWWGLYIEPIKTGRLPTEFIAGGGRCAEQGEEKLCEELYSP